MCSEGKLSKDPARKRSYVKANSKRRGQTFSCFDLEYPASRVEDKNLHGLSPLAYGVPNIPGWIDRRHQSHTCNRSLVPMAAFKENFKIKLCQQDTALNIMGQSCFVLKPTRSEHSLATRLKLPQFRVLMVVTEQGHK